MKDMVWKEMVIHVHVTVSDIAINMFLFIVQNICLNSVACNCFVLSSKTLVL